MAAYLWQFGISLICTLGFGVAQIERGVNTFGETFELSASELASCEKNNGFTLDRENCCGFVRCFGRKGIRMQCPFMSVWHPQKCICVRAEESDECVILGCPNPLPDFDDSCPDFLEEQQCCLRTDGYESQIYTGMNDTAFYMYKGQLQECPPGQIFYVDSCCCEGEVDYGLSAPCAYFSFDKNYKDISGIHSDPFDIILHNGAEGGAHSSISIEVVITESENLIVAGVKACDRVQDIFIPLNENLVVGQWYHICLSYDKEGFVHVDLDGLRYTDAERNRIDMIDLINLALTALGDIVVVLNNVDFGPILNPEIGAFRQLLDIVYAFVDPLTDEEYFFGMENWILTRDQMVKLLVDYLTKTYRQDEFFDPFAENLDIMINIVNRPRDITTLLSEASKQISDSLLPVAKEIGDPFLVQAIRDLFIRLTKLESIISDIDPLLQDQAGFMFHKIDDYITLGRISLGWLKRRKRSVDALIDTLPSKEKEHFSHLLKRSNLLAEGQEESRQKREVVDIPGVPSIAPITRSKYPIRVGDGLVGAIDELVICNFVPNEEAQFLLYNNNIVPRHPESEHRDV
ncbi:unnamed protein product [Owenia fusiformis]|uniref:Chitin-binding type-2 domain-containing protein n=1 Tax=Owenia fusiformis TaxID=6347 RepID=A0A8S4PML6_OWEFU|nr:unnamed protein product [Owenia fusiformis]